MYVRGGQRGGLGRVAGANRVPRLGRLRGVSRAQRAALGGLTRAEMGALYRRLGQINYADFTVDGIPISTLPQPIISTPAPGTPGWTPALQAGLLSQTIATAGNVAARAVSPTPSVTYNPATGQYVATGGATLPAGLALGSTFTSLFSNPLVLLGIAGIAVVVMVSRR
jgi:hypothetical protein